MAVQMQRVHAELKASVWGTWRQHLTEPTAPVPAPSVTRLLEMWDYEAGLTIQVTMLALSIRGVDHDKCLQYIRNNIDGRNSKNKNDSTKSNTSIINIRHDNCLILLEHSAWLD